MYRVYISDKILNIFLILLKAILQVLNRLKQLKIIFENFSFIFFHAVLFVIMHADFSVRFLVIIIIILIIC